MPVTMSSTLMQNHVAGRPLPAQRALAALCAADQSPILVALDVDGRLTATLRSTAQTTGWIQVDLTSQLADQGGLGASPVVQCFAAQQDADGSIWLVIAAYSGSSKDSKILLTRALSDSGAESDWTSLAQGLVPRAVPSGLQFTNLVLGSGDDGEGAPHIVGVAMSGGMMGHYQINPDPADTSWSCLPIALPQNATACLAATAGIVPGMGRGVYALCALGTLTNLTFTTLPTMQNGVPVTKSRQFTLPAGYTPTTVSAISALPVSSGQTELYLSGAGLHRYSLTAQSKSNQSPVQIADATLFTGTSQLLAACDGADPAAIDVWALNNADLLVATTGKQSGSDYTWQTPLYLGNEVTALAAFRAGASAAAGNGVSTLALGKSDGSLALTAKDPKTCLWGSQSVSLQASDTALTLQTYTTRIVVTDDNNVTVNGATVLLQPAVDAPALVNGQYIALKAGVAKPVVTDPQGVITVVLETDDITVPAYTVTYGTTSQPTDPGQNVKEALRGISTGDDIAYAKRCDGSPLFTDVDQDIIDACDIAAAGIVQLMRAHDDLEPPSGSLGASGGRRRPDRPKKHHVRHSVGCRRVDGRLEALHGEAAMTAQGTGIDIIDDAGDLLWSALNGALEVGEWFVNELDDGWQFCINLGNQVLAFFIEVADQALSAIDFVLEYTVGITLSDIIDWLGFLFHWGDILQNHKVVAHMLDLVFDYSVSILDEIRDGMIDGFDAARAALVDDRLDIAMTDSYFGEPDYVAPGGQEPESQTPEANWALQQVNDNIAGTTVQHVNTSDPGDLFGCVTQSELDTLQEMIDAVQDEILDGFEGMSYSELGEVFLRIVGETIIDTVQNVSMCFFDAVAAVVPGFHAMAAARWDIPVITWLYEEVICEGDGSRLTMIDLIALLTVIPATATGKAINGQNMFSDGTANAVLASTTWDQMVDALAGTDYAAADGLLDTDGDFTLQSAAMVVLTAAFTRSFACAFYWAREFGGSATKDDFNNLKVIYDWLTWALSVANMELIQKVRPDTSTRVMMDRLITTSQLLIRVRDTFNALYKNTWGVENPIKGILGIAESGFGVWILITTIWSYTLEVDEKPPDGTSEDTWKAMYQAKFTQNLMTGVYRVFAFVANLPDSPTKTAIVAFRGTCLVIRAAAGLVLGGLSVGNAQSDVGD